MAKECRPPLAGMNVSILQIDGIAGVMPALKSLGGEIERLRTSARVSAEEVQSLASDLTQLRLLLNELERKDACGKGTNRGASDRSIELEALIKRLRDDLEQIMMRVTP